jgi:rubrerythrin
MNTYEGFTAALERRPVNVSPLTWLADLDERPPEASAWMLRWLEEQRESTAGRTCARCGYVEQPSVESHRCPACGERYE